MYQVISMLLKLLRHRMHIFLRTVTLQGISLTVIIFSSKETSGLQATLSDVLAHTTY